MDRKRMRRSPRSRRPSAAAEHAADAATASGTTAGGREDSPKGTAGGAQPASLRRQVYDVLEEGPASGPLNWIVTRALIALIGINLLAVVLQSVPDLEHQYGRVFDMIELVSLVIFTIEYALRLWVAPEHELKRHPSDARARLHYAVSWVGLIDLLSVLPFWLAPFVPDEFRTIMVLRVFRFLKLARYSPSVRSLLEALYEERRALLGCMLILFGATIIVASIMHLVEGAAQPDKFGTIPAAMWWAIVTLGTIGYGDVVPVTPLGRLIGAFAIFGGLIMVALPVGIVATAFADAIHRRDFVVTWGMVVRVPLFAGLTADEISEIIHLLKAQTAEPGTVIAQRGEPAHSMYFISSGEVAIDIDNGPVRLGDGHFFGEVAVLRGAERSATVRAVRRTHLLVLDAEDFRALLQRQPKLAERLNETARDRIGRELVSPDGDLIAEELNEADDKPPAKSKGKKS
jgi:voltage-gated potassium channel